MKTKESNKKRKAFNSAKAIATSLKGLQKLDKTKRYFKIS